MNAQTPTIRKFNPGTHQSDEEVIRQFVVRKGELQIVLRTLAENVDAACCQHLLLIAPRGRGKTMMLARVAAEIRTNGELSPHYLPIRFMEENEEIFSIDGFWLETLFNLAKAAEEHDAELAVELAKAHAEFTTRWRERDLSEQVRATVLGAADRIGKKLLLMVENLQSLQDNVDDDFGWQLRETLQCDPQIALLATATSRFAALDNAKEAFFELFRTINLEPLDTESCRHLWLAISGEGLSDREIKPLQILTGGSPRFLVVMGEFSKHRSMRQLLEELVKLIDDHTEYFRSCIGALAKQERRVYLAAADLWQPSTTSEITARARMDVRAASTLIGRLVNRGALIVHGSGRKQSYSVAERLYCIYYKLRRERGEAAIVQSLIHFMAAFYRKREFASLMEKFRIEAIKFPVIQEGLKRWSIESPELNQALTNDGSTSPSSDDHEPERLEAMRLFEKAWQLGERGRGAEEAAAYDKIVDRFASSDALETRKLIGWALVNKGAALGNLGRNKEEIAAYDDVVDRFADSDAPELAEVAATALANKGVTLGRLGRDDEESATYDEVIRRFGNSNAPGLHEPVTRALVFKATVALDSERPNTALAVCDDICRRIGPPAPSAVIALWLRTEALALLGQHAEAIGALKAAYEALDPNDSTLMPIACVTILTTAQVDEKRIIQILTSDEAKAVSFWPLVVALRLRLGEEVRAPTEVHEVAKDLMRYIEERSHDESRVLSATHI